MFVHKAEVNIIFRLILALIDSCLMTGKVWEESSVEEGLDGNKQRESKQDVSLNNYQTDILQLGVLGSILWCFKEEKGQSYL